MGEQSKLDGKEAKNQKIEELIQNCETIIERIEKRLEKSSIMA